MRAGKRNRGSQPSNLPFEPDGRRVQPVPFCLMQQFLNRFASCRLGFRGRRVAVRPGTDHDDPVMSGPGHTYRMCQSSQRPGIVDQVDEQHVQFVVAAVSDCPGDCVGQRVKLAVPVVNLPAPTIDHRLRPGKTLINQQPLQLGRHLQVVMHKLDWYLRIESVQLGQNCGKPRALMASPAPPRNHRKDRERQSIHSRIEQVRKALVTDFE